LGVLLPALLTLLAVLVVSVASASADLTVCSPGSAAGQCSNPNGVATDFETKRVYVADEGNNRIDVLEVDEGESRVKFLYAFGWGVDTGAEAFQVCTEASTCQAGREGQGLGEFSKPRQVAVDNDVSSGSHHAIYVYDSGNERVEKFVPQPGPLDVEVVKTSKAPVEFHDPQNRIATGPGGDVYMGDLINFEEETVIKKLNAELESVSECAVPGQRLVGGLAVDSVGDFYAGSNKGGASTFHSDCSEFGSPYPLESVASLAVDGADELYVTHPVNGARPKTDVRVVSKFDSAGVLERRFGFGSLMDTETLGVAPLPSSVGDVFASEKDGSVKYLREPPAGPVVGGVEVFPGNARASIEAEVDPEGKASEFGVEWVDESHFKSEGGFASAKTKSSPFSVVPGAADFELHLGSVLAGCPVATRELVENETCLRPETVYHYRVRVQNPDGGGNGPVEGTFETRPPFEVQDVFAGEVGSDSGRLSARVDPLGVSAEGWFEIVDQAAFETGGFAGAVRVPDVGGGGGGGSPLDFGSGEGGVTRGVSVDLAPGTTYHARFQGTDSLIDGSVGSKEIVFGSFRGEQSEGCVANEAFRTGLSGLLADCRAYELVSPLDKEGADIVTIKDGSGYPHVLSQSSVGGDKLAYGSYRAFGDAKAAPVTAQYVASRGASGWASHYVLGPHERANTSVVGELYSPTELRLLSGDLCQGWVGTVAEPPLAAKALVGQLNLYSRIDQEEDCGGVESWEAFTTAKPVHGQFGAFGSALELQGVSADGSRAVYMTEDNLEGTEAPDLKGEGFALYYQSNGEGKPRYVCYGTDGNPIKTNCGAGRIGRNQLAPLSRTSDQTGAISADGERVFWSTWSDSTGEQSKIFLREHPGQHQSLMSGGKCVEASKACTIAVSAKGEELSGTKSASAFWLAAKDGSRAFYTTGGTLYEFDVETGVTSVIAHKVLGVMGASEDASRLYFASEEALTGEANSAGGKAIGDMANLYLAENGSFRFVGIVSPPKNSSPEAMASSPALRDSRVSPDGEHALFTSSEPLTGYDSTDAHSPAHCGEPEGHCDSEVFAYDASAREGKGRLTCVSCNPTGARPTGRLLEFPGGVRFWAAAWLGVWKTSLYPGRLMRDDGTRVYFEALDALSPRDSNGAADVYQWERPGAGGEHGCREGSPSFSVQDEGCVSLISSGQSAGDSALVDVSASGGDVFFTTAQSLLAEDYGLVDIYDARVNGGLPEPPARPAGCEGEACQNPAQVPNYLTPASSVFQGEGNLLVEPVVQVKAKTRTLTRAQKLARALHACTRRPRRDRAKCRITAHRRFGSSANSSATGSGELDDEASPAGIHSLGRHTRMGARDGAGGFRAEPFRRDAHRPGRGNGQPSRIAPLLDADVVSDEPRTRGWQRTTRGLLEGPRSVPPRRAGRRPDIRPDVRHDRLPCRSIRKRASVRGLDRRRGRAPRTAGKDRADPRSQPRLQPRATTRCRRAPGILRVRYTGDVHDRPERSTTL
jgi:hypothetical protein